MRIFRAIYTNWKTQGFGIEGTRPEFLPFYQSLGLTAHNGFDFAAGDGQKVHWDCDIAGEVIETHTDNKGGLGVIAVTKDIDGMFKHRFWHLKDFACKAGDILGSGDLLGYADNTGLSFGNHLHRDLKKVEKDEFGNYRTLNHDNGFFGCIDMTPFFENIWVVDKMKYLQKKIEILTAQLNLWQKIINLLKTRIF